MIIRIIFNYNSAQNYYATSETLTRLITRTVMAGGYHSVYRYCTDDGKRHVLVRNGVNNVLLTNSDKA